ncbi:MAG TPA: retron system putative HNH endonuclease [Thermoanaerobaculia bacterium]|nr:retron system putative HNH endonuclease [Thermoanaerobaculia bacterium]
MIHIDRDCTDTAGKPIQPDLAWFKLSKQWTDEALKDGPIHVVKDHVYRHESVKIALEELFHRKCAYCETPLSEVGWEVEHFRPKGRVAERLDHSGYYWLAYTWQNLYPSCVPCNQGRQDKPTWDDPITGNTAGKVDQFPIADEALRAMDPAGSLTKENPLLLDPCADDPEQSFRYTPLGGIEAVPGDLRAETSIQVFHLTRKRLRDGRRGQIKTIVLLLRIMEQLRLTDDPDRVAQFESEIEAKFFSDSAPFAGTARFVRGDRDAFGV